MTTTSRLESAQDPSPRRDIGWGSVIAIGLAMGLATGLLEAVITVGGKVAFNAAKSFGMQFWWMAPVAEAALFLAVAVVAAAAATAARVRRWPVVAGTLAGLAALSVALLFHRLDKIAVLLLGLGVGVRTFIVARRRPPLRPSDLEPGAAGAVLVVALGALIVEGRGLLGGHQAVAATGRPNVLFIVLDTEGAANLHLYGYQRPTSPFLDSLAASSVVFSRAYATAPWTLPSHGSLFTGRDADELSTSFRTPLDDAYPTLAETFRREGYRTGGFVANLRFTNREFGLARGFDHYEDYSRRPAELLLASSLIRRLALHGGIRQLTGYHDIVGRKRADQITDGVLDWVDQERGRPWFAFLNYWDAHEPYFPPAETAARFVEPGARRDFTRADYRIRETILHEGTRKRFAPAVVRAERDSYDASIAAVDRELARLFRALEARRLAEETIVVITADHGEEHGERGHFTHAHSVNPAALWVPLIVRFPRAAPPGRRIDSVVSTRHLATTVLQLAGVEPPATMIGPSLASYWRDGTTPAEVAVSSFFDDNDTAFSVIMGEVQFQRENGVDRLLPLSPVHDTVTDLVEDPRYRAVVERGRAIVDSVTGLVRARAVAEPDAP